MDVSLRAIINKFTLLVPKGSTFVGHGHSNDGLYLRIDGSYKGSLTLGPGSVVLVGKDGYVNCDRLIADHIFALGVLEGDIEARESFELFSSSRVRGRLTGRGKGVVHLGSDIRAGVVC